MFAAGKLERKFCVLAVVAASLVPAAAQKRAALPRTAAPVVDASVPGPVAPAPAAPVVDASVESSPAGRTAGKAEVASHAEIRVKLNAALDSGSLRNGDSVRAVLSAPVRRSDGTVLPSGTEVVLTVVAVAHAGEISSAGEASLQVVKVGNAGVFSDVATIHGQEGKKVLPDSNPAKGTEASLPAGAELTFRVPTVPPSPPVPASPRS